MLTVPEVARRVGKHPRPFAAGSAKGSYRPPRSAPSTSSTRTTWHSSAAFRQRIVLTRRPTPWPMWSPQTDAQGPSGRLGSGRRSHHTARGSQRLRTSPSEGISGYPPSWAGSSGWSTRCESSCFGSRARGDARDDSNRGSLATRHRGYDILVILDEVENRRATRIRIRGALDDLPIAKDVIVATADEVAGHHGRPWGVLHWALAEGRVVYERA